jgi:hypothetical protein
MPAMTAKSPKRSTAEKPEPLDVAKGVKSFILWLGGSLTGISALLYACGYLVTRAHLHMLGLYGLVDYRNEYFLQEGSKFLIAVANELDSSVIAIARVALTNTALTAIGFVALLVWLARRMRAKFVLGIRARLRRARATVSLPRLPAYVLLFVLAATGMHESLVGAQRALTVRSLLYEPPDPAICNEEGLKAALLCNRVDELEAAFEFQLFYVFFILLVVALAWNTVMPWRHRGWLIAPFLIPVAMSLMLLPMVYGALLRSQRYPVMTLAPSGELAGAVDGEVFLINLSDKEFVVWNKATRKVIWLPASAVPRAEITTIAPLFPAPTHPARRN